MDLSEVLILVKSNHYDKAALLLTELIKDVYWVLQSRCRKSLLYFPSLTDAIFSVLIEGNEMTVLQKESRLLSYKDYLDDLTVKEFPISSIQEHIGNYIDMFQKYPLINRNSREGELLKIIQRIIESDHFFSSENLFRIRSMQSEFTECLTVNARLHVKIETLEEQLKRLCTDITDRRILYTNDTGVQTTQEDAGINLEKNEIGSLQQEMLDLNQDVIQRLQEEIRAYKKENSDLKISYATLETLHKKSVKACDKLSAEKMCLSKEQSEFDVVYKDYQNCNKELEKLKRRIVQVENDFQDCSKKLSDSDLKNDKLKGNINVLRNKNESLASEIKEKDVEINQLNSKYLDTKNETLNLSNVVKSLQAELKKKNRETEILNDQLEENSRELTKMMFSERQSLEYVSDLDTLKDKLQDLENENVGLKNQVVEFNDYYEGYTKIKHENTEILKSNMILHEQITSMNIALNDLTSENEKLSKDRLSIGIVAEIEKICGDEVKNIKSILHLLLSTFSANTIAELGDKLSVIGEQLTERGVHDFNQFVDRVFTDFNKILQTLFGIQYSTDAETVVAKIKSMFGVESLNSLAEYEERVKLYFTNDATISEILNQLERVCSLTGTNDLNQLISEIDGLDMKNIFDIKQRLDRINYIEKNYEKPWEEFKEINKPEISLGEILSFLQNLKQPVTQNSLRAWSLQTWTVKRPATDQGERLKKYSSHNNDDDENDSGADNN